MPTSTGPRRLKNLPHAHVSTVKCLWPRPSQQSSRLPSISRICLIPSFDQQQGGLQVRDSAQSFLCEPLCQPPISYDPRLHVAAMRKSSQLFRLAGCLSASNSRSPSEGESNCARSWPGLPGSRLLPAGGPSTHVLGSDQEEHLTEAGQSLWDTERRKTLQYAQVIVQFLRAAGECDAMRDATKR